GERMELSFERASETDQRGAGIPSAFHRRGARMVLLAPERDPQLDDADDRRHDADAFAGRLEPAALLDMGFEIGDIAVGFHPRQRLIGEAGGADRLAHEMPFAIARARDNLGHRLAAERAAADEAGIGPLLVDPGGDVDSEVTA